MFGPTLPFVLLSLTDPRRPPPHTPDLALAQAEGGNTDLPVLRHERCERRARARQRLAERVRRRAA